ncbi:MAG: Thiamine pyrophosphate protein central region [Microgenomates group bacterium GW2011_GWA2_44_7]|nr:MAG: Thiamine pyrophosphate protein central region [Microgenomates group bacterium GW2011_GWA2_44_7]
MKTNSKGHSKNLIRVADYIAQFLVDKKINDIFVLTGFGAMYINDAIAANPKLKYYCVRNEATSPMMAEAYARIKHIPGAVCLTAGPGSTNAVPGLAEAWVDSAPVIVISGQVDKKHTTNYSNLPNLRTFGTAEIDIIPIIKPITKYSVMITKPESIRYHLEKAYFLATSDRPGPVWIDVPQDVQYALINPKKLKGFKPIKAKASYLNKQIKQVLKYLILSKKPLIVAGQGIRQSEAISDFKKLISTLNIPFTLTRLEACNPVCWR